MSLLSLFRKKNQDAPTDTGDFQSRSEGESADLRNPGSRPKRKSARRATEPIDPMLPEKKRARRRLVGAVALVLAAIIGLPMILDAEQKPLSEDVVIQIPSRDQVSPASIAGSRGARVAANAALDPAEEVVGSPPSPSQADATSNPTSNPTVTAPAAAAVTVEKSEPSANRAPAKPASTHTETRSAEKTESAPPRKTTDKTLSSDTHSSDSERAQAILEGGAGPAKAEKKNAKVMVQVAALASQEKVDELRGKLKAAGMSSVTQTVATDSGPRIRVRIGPFGSKQEADTARSKLTKLGLSGTLVPS